ncbi:hypothetical protein [Leptothrix discophora]|uniref:Uncharacterized protein n=1 Tax=Leptothrix discophora TaxID=89 RepID=A0ABT9G8Z7_LEPDI|nr:hypothetical protein [Leptothrix discophora]MDP4302959.1 hypothetical protein [Leptothrix discophora]
MPYALVWSAVFALLALWSLTAWALHAVGVWTVMNAGALGGVTAGLGGAWQWPAWLAPWVPPALTAAVADAFTALAPFVHGLLHAAPALAGGVTVAAWGVWAVGGLLLVMLGVAGHAAIVVWRRRASLAMARPDRMVAAG